MLTRTFMTALVGGLFVAGTALAQVPEPPPLPAPESDVVCDNDLPDADGDGNAEPNNCDCALPDDPSAVGPSGCIAIGPICLAGDIASLTGCLSLAGEAAGGANVCSNGPGVIAQCSDEECAQTASAGCGAGGGGAPELPIPTEPPPLPLP